VDVVSIRRIAPRARKHAESIMTDVCTIERLGAEVFDPETGTSTPARTLVYAGKCRVRPQPGIATRDVRTGENIIGTHAPLVSIPYTVTDIAGGDVVTVTQSMDPGLVGRTLVVQVVSEGSQISARRLLVQELSTGGA
jgi:hypothetical protein